MAIQQGILNKGTTKLSAGTRVEILHNAYDDPKWEKPGDTIYSGFSHVRLRNKPSYKLRENGFPADGIFDIEAECVTILRPREDLVPSNLRSVRRRGMKRKATESNAS